MEFTYKSTINFNVVFRYKIKFFTHGFVISTSLKFVILRSIILRFPLSESLMTTASQFLSFVD